MRKHSCVLFFYVILAATPATYPVATPPGNLFCGKDIYLTITRFRLFPSVLPFLDFAPRRFFSLLPLLASIQFQLSLRFPCFPRYFYAIDRLSSRAIKELPSLLHGTLEIAIRQEVYAIPGSALHE